MVALVLIMSVIPTVAFAKKPGQGQGPDNCVEGKLYEEVVIQATCTQPGMKNVVWGCTKHNNCPKTERRTVPETIPVNASAHNMVVDSGWTVITEANCYQPGLKVQYRICGNPGCTHKDPVPANQETIPATGVHQIVTTNGAYTPATCTAPGQQEILKTCATPGCPYSDTETNPLPVDPTAHQMTIGPFERIIMEPTCSQEGMKEYYKNCANCGREENCGTEMIPVNADNHLVMAGPYEETVIAPTCSQEGLKQYYMACGACGHREILSEEILLKLPHEFPFGLGDQIGTSFDCTQESYWVKTCLNCGEQEWTTNAGASDHDWIYSGTTYPDGCESVGVNTYTCRACGTTKYEGAQAFAHRYVNGVCECGAVEGPADASDSIPDTFPSHIDGKPSAPSTMPPAGASGASDPAGSTITSVVISSAQSGWDSFMLWLLSLLTRS